ncbi:MAG: ABC transporter permease subunit [Phycisphaeraceae bacterium]|nr:ABC transporter permease subunit [Phycisphaeraceae bacterium]
MFTQVFTIARNTFTESIRQPIFIVLTMVGTLGMILNPSLAAYTLDDDNKFMVDIGLSTLFLIGVFLASLTATSVLSSEIDNKTVLTVVSKPVARPLFVFGKFLGVLAAIALSFWSITVVFLLTVRHGVMQTASDKFDLPVIVFGYGLGFTALLISTLGNYFYRWVFNSTYMIAHGSLMTLAIVLVLFVSKQWHFQLPIADLRPQLLMGLLMVFMGVAILTAIALAVSTRLGQVMTLLICCSLFFLGLGSQSIFGRYANDSFIARVLYVMTPNLQILWPADALTQGHNLTLGYLGLTAVYVVLMITAILGLAVALFQNREVG